MPASQASTPHASAPLPKRARCPRQCAARCPQPIARASAKPALKQRRVPTKPSAQALVLRGFTAAVIWIEASLCATGRAAEAADSTAAGPSGSPAFCELDALSAAFRRFAFEGQGDGFDGGGSIQALLAYYKRLSCTDAQIDRALEEALQGIVPIGATGGLSNDTAGTLSALNPYLWQTAIAGVGAFGLLCWQDRPRGWVAGDLVVTGPSTVAGTGLFARVDIPAQTVLGGYPGRLRSAPAMREKVEQAPNAAGYAFLTRSGAYLDPTDAQGNVSEWPGPGLPWPLAAPSALAYANEPVKGGTGTNTTCEDGEQDTDLLFVTCRALRAGEEVFIDYGTTYDRSGYKR